MGKPTFGHLNRNPRAGFTMCKSIFEPLCSICGLPPAMVDFLASMITTPPVRDPDTKLYKL